MQAYGTSRSPRKNTLRWLRALRRRLDNVEMVQGVRQYFTTYCLQDPSQDDIVTQMEIN